MMVTVHVTMSPVEREIMRLLSVKVAYVLIRSLISLLRLTTNGLMGLPRCTRRSPPRSVAGNSDVPEFFRRWPTERCDLYEKKPGFFSCEDGSSARRGVARPWGSRIR